MSAPAVVTLVLVARLAVAVDAQSANDEAPPDPIPPRIELGAAGGAAATSPEFGVLASLPVGDRLSLDVSLGHLTRVWRAPPYVISQAQVRVPFRKHLRSRRSLLVGVTHVAPYAERGDDSGIWATDRPFLYPHIGTSLQWSLGSRADVGFRLDTQLVIQFNDALIPVVPRAVGAFVWHPETGGFK
jgi:hypothetical protein